MKLICTVFYLSVCCFVEMTYAEYFYNDIFSCKLPRIPRIKKRLTVMGPLEWWQTSVIYQIYILSFMDNDGDGKGDLRGLASKVDYLKDIGVGAVWFSPIYSSPMVDLGYDVSNYTDIDDIFGNLKDLLYLKKKLKAAGIKLILDFVPNHTSDKHSWFTKSAAKEGDYTDYYIWKNASLDEQGRKKPPNNWVSVSNTGSAWHWHEGRQQYYLHQFLSREPDLNYGNLNVNEEIKRVLTFWMDFGVDGFRVNAIPHLVEDTLLRDEPYADVADNESTHYESLVHLYTRDQPETYEIVTQWRQHVDNYVREKNTEPKILLFETYTSINFTMMYYGTPDSPGRAMPLNPMILLGNNECGAVQINSLIQWWMDFMPEEMWPNWTTGNHEYSRLASRFDPGSACAITMLALLLPGTSLVYYGDEIGMENTFIKWNDTVDIYSRLHGPELGRYFSRDMVRTPFQWDDSISAGFSLNTSTWLPTNPNYWRLNLDIQKEDKNSHYNIFKRVVPLRKTKTIQRGDWETYVLSESIFVLTRSLKGAETYVLVINFGSHSENVVLGIRINFLPDIMEIHTGSVNSNLENGDTVHMRGGGFQMRPKMAVILTNQQAPPDPPPDNAATFVRSSLFSVILPFILTLMRLS